MRVSGRHVVGGRQSSPILEVRQGDKQGLWKRSTLRWDGRQLSLDKTVGFRVWRHSQSFGGQPAASGVGIVLENGSGLLSTGSPAGRTPPHGDGSKKSLAKVRVESVLRSPPERCRPWSWTLKRCRNVTPWKSLCFGCESVRLDSRTGDPVRNATVPLDCDDFAHKDVLLQRNGEQNEKLSQQDRLSKFCLDVGFLNLVEIGHYFMTKDAAELSQLTNAVACREYTLPRDEDTSEPKSWIRGNSLNWARIGNYNFLLARWIRSWN